MESLRHYKHASPTIEHREASPSHFGQYAPFLEPNRRFGPSVGTLRDSDIGLAPCATLSMLTYYRTSRSLHFPFWAVCSLSGTQPEIWSVGWNPPVHRMAFPLFVAFPSIHVLRRQPRRRVRGPRAPLARSTRAVERSAQDDDQ